jgi:hypothetical protein
MLRLAIERGETFERIATALRTEPAMVRARFEALRLERPGIRIAAEIHPRWYDRAFFADVRRMVRGAGGDHVHA